MCELNLYSSPFENKPMEETIPIIKEEAYQTGWSSLASNIANLVASIFEMFNTAASLLISVCFDSKTKPEEKSETPVPGWTPIYYDDLANVDKNPSPMEINSPTEFKKYCYAMSFVAKL